MCRSIFPVKLTVTRVGKDCDKEFKETVTYRSLTQYVLLKRRSVGYGCLPPKPNDVYDSRRLPCVRKNNYRGTGYYQTHLLSMKEVPRKRTIYIRRSSKDPSSSVFSVPIDTYRAGYLPECDRTKKMVFSILFPYPKVLYSVYPTD